MAVEQLVRGEAHRASVSHDLTDLTGFLAEQLGHKLTAYLAGGNDPKAVTAWARGTRRPRDGVRRRLRAAYQIFVLLQSGDADDAVRSWFIGMNPQLDDRTPADVLRDGDPREVLAAARAYLAGG
jgi:hypothetical protein